MKQKFIFMPSIYNTKSLGSKMANFQKIMKENGIEYNEYEIPYKYHVSVFERMYESNQLNLMMLLLPDYFEKVPDSVKTQARAKTWLIKRLKQSID